MITSWAENTCSMAHGFSVCSTFPWASVRSRVCVSGGRQPVVPRLWGPEPAAVTMSTQSGLDWTALFNTTYTLSHTLTLRSQRGGCCTTVSKLTRCPESLAWISGRAWARQRFFSKGFTQHQNILWPWVSHPLTKNSQENHLNRENFREISGWTTEEVSTLCRDWTHVDFIRSLNQNPGKIVFYDTRIEFGNI